MKVSYEYSGLNSWDLSNPTLFIDSKELNKSNKNELNKLISIYVNGIEAYCGKEAICDDLYLTLKMWSIRDGMFAINARRFDNLLNPVSLEPIRVFEIAFLEPSTHQFIMIYEVTSVNASGTKINNTIVMDPKNCKYSYSIRRPKLEINL